MRCSNAARLNCQSSYGCAFPFSSVPLMVSTQTPCAFSHFETIKKYPRLE